MVSPKLVSVVMPVYNGGRTLARAIDSILAQTHTMIEVIVCDNNSSDATSSIVLDRESRDPRVKYFRHQTNIGGLMNVLYGISKTTGRFVLIAGDDDFWESTYIEVLLNLLSVDPCAGIAQSAIARMTTSGSTVNVCDLSTYVDSSLKERQCAKSSARKRLRELLFSEKCKDGYNPYNMLVLGLIDGGTMRSIAANYPSDLVHDRAFMSVAVVKKGWVFSNEILMKKTSIHDRPYNERRAPEKGEDIVTIDKRKYSSTMKRFLTLRFLLTTNCLTLSEKFFVVLPQFFYFVKFELKSWMGCKLRRA